MGFFVIGDDLLVTIGIGRYRGQIEALSIPVGRLVDRNKARAGWRVHAGAPTDVFGSARQSI